MYTFFFAVTIRKDKPALATGINGAWLIAAVATQSVSILGTLLSGHIESGREIILFFTLCMYLLGCMLYLNIITLIFYRFTFINLEHAALTPPYWINMGAVAITVLAGSTLMLHAQHWALIVEILPFLKGFTLFFWMAFPLAMYTTSTFQLAQALDTPFLVIIPRVMVYAAMTAWLTIFLSLIHHLYSSYRKRDQSLMNNKNKLQGR